MSNVTLIDLRMTRARAALIRDHAFFGSLAMHLDIVPDPKAETFSTDGRELKYNPAFLDTLTETETQTVVGETALHCALGHHTRMGGRDLKRWNAACDFVVWPMLRDAGFSIPYMAHGWFREEFKGMNAEAIYKHLEEEESIPPDPETGAGAPDAEDGSSMSMGEVTPAAGEHDQAALQEASEEWEVTTRQAVNVAKRQAGDVPGFIQEVIEHIEESVVDWRSILRQFVEPSTTKDYSWAQPNRRMLGLGYIVPGVVSDGVAHIAVAIDTSASVNTEALQKIGGEVQALLDEGAVDMVTVLFADTRVNRIVEYVKGETIDFTCDGRGGTAFAPTFAKIEELQDVRATIYFTDLECWEFGPEPNYPVLWAQHGSYGNQPPFGEVLKLPM